WAYSGVNFSLASSGGPDCVTFLTVERKILETVLISFLSILQISFAWSDIKSASVNFQNVGKVDDRISNSMNKFLALLSLAFGIEIGFKLSTRQVIWLLNPCHMITMAQIFLLSATPSKTSLIIFRLHLYYLIGPIIALIIPVVHSRKLLLEREMYFIQHVLILVAPYFIMKNKAYTVERKNDMSWPVMAQGLVFLFHFTVLQALSILTQVNIDNIICPASADPFSGQWYRMVGVAHQTFLITITGKL
ncbi:hypothetical protein HELRODRAFT_133970, partial [Helobdella robusta]|uniref:Transmembrane protein 164 n=1 Tax=Helobdella robusta TaxID=6412 RepID=T1EI30_HELRO